MRGFSKDKAANGHTYAELQKKASEKVNEYKQEVAAYKEILEQYEKDMEEQKQRMDELLEQVRQLEENQPESRLLEEIKQEDLAFLKEKQEYVLKNFPTLEGNVVEKIKSAQADNARELLEKLDELIRREKSRNLTTKLLLWFSFVLSLASAGGVILILLYLADYIVF